MAFISDTVLDAALQVIRDAVTPILHLCSSEPTNFAGVAAVTLGNKAAPTVGAQANGAVSGRSVSIATFTDGTITATGTATHWAFVDANSSALLFTVAVPASQAVTSGNPLSMTSALVVNIPDPA